MTVVVLFAGIGGCQAPESPVELTRQTLALGGDEAYDALFDDCVEALRRRGFNLDRVDRRAGVITTLPETSEHFLEFWRRDVVTSYDAMEASVCTLRRRAEVGIERPAGAAEATLTVTVDRERLSTPDRQYNNSGAAFLVYGEALPATTGRPISPISDVDWIADGRDGALEAALIREMTGSGPSLSAPGLEPAAPTTDTEPAS